MAEDGRLFDGLGYAIARPPALTRFSSTKVGRISEHLAIAELLGRGHPVALPVADDEGIDLVVDYRTTVQVKSSRTRNWGGGQTDGWIFSHDAGRSDDAHILLAHAPLADAWWVIPYCWLREAGWSSRRSNGITLTVSQIRKRTRYADLCRATLDAWGLFDEDWR